MSYGVCTCPDPIPGLFHYDGCPASIWSAPLGVAMQSGDTFTISSSVTLSEQEEGQEMSEIERLQRALDRIDAEHDQRRANLERQLARVLTRPAEPELEDGECPVIRWDMRFYPGGQVYSYAAIRCDDDLWYTTGPNAPKGYGWDTLIAWIEEKELVGEIWAATEMEALP